jgi:hypothetical protein
LYGKTLPRRKVGESRAEEGEIWRRRRFVRIDVAKVALDGLMGSVGTALKWLMTRSALF